MGYLVKAVHRELDDYHYFTVQGKDLEQVYVQVATYNYGYNVSTRYRPSRKQGSGRNIRENISSDILLEVVLQGFSTAIGHAHRYGFPTLITENSLNTTDTERVNLK